MLKRVLTTVGLIGVLLAGCDGAPSASVSPTLEIAPQDFVVLPCGEMSGDRPCALAVAGGKRVMFGAPAGATQVFSAADLRLLDAVFVFSLRARDLEGLDELRNQSWRAGRATPLLVIGPNGIEEVIEALNKTFEQSDALRIVEEGIPPGGYDAAVMTARAASQGQTVFDTGDVQVRAARAGYNMLYNGTARLEFRNCDRAGETVIDPSTVEKQVKIGCDAAQADAVWPLVAPLVIVKN